MGSTPIFSLCYDFHLAAAISTTPCSIGSYSTGNNSNVYRILNNVDSTRSTTYTYDTLNRLSQANTITTTGGNCWGETYTVDPWGNMYNRGAVSGMTGCSYEALAATASTKNQLSTMSHDAAGNVTNDGVGNLPTYDNENRIATDAGVTYSYDADGVRIEKSSGTMYWPGPSGVIAETDLSGTINEEYVFFNGARIARVDRPSGAMHYYFSDHLGSASAIASATGGVQQQYFYYPYGGQQSAIGSDTNRYKFTGKERDSESGLDNFTARYFGSSMGRFMSPDPRGGHPEDPQTLNRYAYVRNNPTTLTDPTGLDFYLRCSGGDTATCNGGHVGTTDDKGNFTATVVTSDSIRAGQNSANVDQNGVEVTTGGKTYSGQYFDNPASHTTDANGNDVNHNPVDLKGGGAFTGFSFNINGNCNGTCLASGSFSFNAPRDFTGSVLELRGSFRSIVDRRIPGWGKSVDEYEFHPGTEQYRFGTGPSPHFSLPDNPKDTVPTVGPFHVDKDAPGLQHLGCAKLGVGCQ